MANERRRYSRVPFNNMARLINAHGQNWLTGLIDVSLKGALLRLPETWTGKLGDHYTLEFHLSGSEQVIRMDDVTVAHLKQGYIGLHCLRIDVDSMTHLKRLMELNTGDVAMIHREIGELGP
ncbi:MAG: PilZ domain-containing protein [Gammaproteobacteria bacterium]|nr:PilZ domain-containing protein [Gammaproteobacteria bacterium]